MEKEPPIALNLLGLERSFSQRQPDDKQIAENVTIWKPKASLHSLVDRDIPGLAMSLGTGESSSRALNIKQNTGDRDHSKPCTLVPSRALPFLESKEEKEHPRGGVLFDRTGLAERGDLSSLLRCKEEPVVTEAQHLQTGMHSPWSTLRDGGSLLSLRTYVDTSREEERNPGCNDGSSDQGLVDTPAPTISSLQQASPMNVGTFGFQIPERTASPLLQNGTGLRYKTMVDNHGGLPDYSYRSAEALSGGRPVATRELLRKRQPELDVSFRKAKSHDAAMFLSNQTAFGSPLPFSTLGANLNSGDDSHLPQAPLVPVQGFHFQAQGGAAKRPGAFVEKKPTAQLTIFYSGQVNVYDSVPADMANAIMLLAGSGNSWCSNRFMNAPRTENGSVPPSSKGATTTGISIASDNTATATPVAYKSTLGLPTSSTAGVTSTTSPGDIKQPPTKRLQPELPYARKASLARFFEKRKDRVIQAKLLQSTNDKCSEAQDVSAYTTETLKRRCSRSPSPSPPSSRLRCSSPSPSYGVSDQPLAMTPPQTPQRLH